MFIKDAFNNTSYEPWWFTIMRRLSALVFVGLVVTYGIVQIEYVNTFINTPNILIIEPKANMSNVNFPGFIICPGSVSPDFINGTAEQKKPIPQFSVECGRSSAIGPEVLSDSVNITDANCANESFGIENGCLKFRQKYINEISSYGSSDDNEKIEKMFSQGLNRTFMFFNIKPNSDESVQPLFYTIYFDEYLHRDNRNYTVTSENEIFEYNMFPITMGQKTILEYSVTVHRAFSNPIMGQLNTKPDNTSVEIHAEIRMVQKNSNNQFGTQFLLMPKMPHYMREEIEKYEYHPGSAISNIGGFYGAIVAFYMACFGMPKIEPWGLLQRTILRCWSCRRSFKRRLARKYVSEAGIPLGEAVEDRPEGSTLDNRIQILEYLLKEYYLDTYYLDNLNTTRLRYESQEQKHGEIETLINGPMGVSIIPSPTISAPAFPSPIFPSPTYPSAYPNYNEEVGTSSSSSSPVSIRVNYHR